MALAICVDMEVVGEDEDLYRRVPNDSEYFSMLDGKLCLTTAAFNDRAKMPSVDRAKISGFNPECTKLNHDDGVVTLNTERVRKIDTVYQKNKKGELEKIYRVDVKAAPEVDNPSHALIVSSPEISNDRVFKRLKESLAKIAAQNGWTIPPDQPA